MRKACGLLLGWTLKHGTCPPAPAPSYDWNTEMPATQLQQADKECDFQDGGEERWYEPRSLNEGIAESPTGLACEREINMFSWSPWLLGVGGRGALIRAAWSLP